MKFKLKAYNIWEFGKRKDSAGNPHQEDSTYPVDGHFKDSDRLFILCDGMGGHDAGEVASTTVCEAMSKVILSECPDSEGKFTLEDFKHALDFAYEALDRKDNGAEKKMGTTMTMLKLHEEGATVAHIGDSRVYHIRPGKDGDSTRILFQTEDHSLINDLIKIGEMTREEARTSGQKNVITRAMQPGKDSRCKADIKLITDIQPGDYFYLCSDGMLEQEEMDNGEALKNIFSQSIDSDEQKVKILKGATDENRDNHTAIIVHIIEVENSEIPVEDEIHVEKEDKHDSPRHIAIVGDEIIEEQPSIYENNRHIEKSVSPEHAKQNKRHNKSMAKWYISLLLLIIIAGGIVGFCFWFGHEENESFNDWSRRTMPFIYGNNESGNQTLQQNEHKYPQKNTGRIEITINPFN